MTIARLGSITATEGAMGRPSSKVARAKGLWKALITSTIQAAPQHARPVLHL